MSRAVDQAPSGKALRSAGSRNYLYLIFLIHISGDFPRCVKKTVQVETALFGYERSMR